MDVTPPSTLRRLGVALAGLGVAALTATACALSFHDLRDLALQARVSPELAFLYPVGFDALLVVALVSVLLLTSGGLLARLQAALVLVLLIVGAAVVNVASATGFQVDVRQAAIVAAVAPWVMLAVALWMWLVLIKHVQERRADSRSTAEQDLVPFRRDAAAPPPLPADGEELEVTEHEPTPVVGPTPAPETPPLPIVKETARTEPLPVFVPATVPEPREAPEDREEVPDLRDQPARPQVAADHELERSEPADTPETPAPSEDRDATEIGEAAETREPVHEPAELPEPAEKREPAENREPAVTAEPAKTPAEPPAEPPEERRPVRWGDLTRPEPSDVLVHPRPETVSERDADTQPVRVFKDNPDPEHGPEAADPPHGRRQPYGEAPSGRRRSTPLPPEDEDAE
ncbi:DUF2637 domain-containing protein [Nonomuraea sp. NPDC050310]|uniref:DUF2637 domain-containing protein n=1 Tax=Nonomuraea sp. NPDC050310 TaxID=3154935 RepID=UPI0033FEADBE